MGFRAIIRFYNFVWVLQAVRDPSWTYSCDWVFGRDQLIESLWLWYHSLNISHDLPDVLRHYLAIISVGLTIVAIATGPALLVVPRYFVLCARADMNSLILKSIDHERLFEEDTVPVSQTKSPWQNLENAILSSRFAAFDNRRRLLRLHCLDIAMIKFLDESESINCCLCTVLVTVQ